MGNGAKRASPGAGLLRRLASVRLTLWLLAFLSVAMATATVLPQGADRAVYQRLFGGVGARVFLGFSLDHAFGAWWFVGAFGLLALNLLACGAQRASDLLQARDRFAEVTEERVRRKPRRRQLRTPAPATKAASVAAEALRTGGYLVNSSELDDRAGVVAERSRLAPWGPVLVHLGVVVVLIGAAWGRLPRNAYHALATFEPGQVFTAEKGRPFSVRVLESGVERDPDGNPTGYWARTELLDRGRPVRHITIRPNHPLRYRAITATLMTLGPAGYALEVKRGAEAGLIPIALGANGTVNMRQSGAVVGDPPWLVVVQDLWQGAEGAAARVYVDESGHTDPQWHEAGWVDERGRSYGEMSLRLTRTPPLTQLSFDRDVGVPIVWTGFALVTIGAVLAAGSARRSVLVLAVASGGGSRVVLGGAGPGVMQDMETVVKRMQAELRGAVETVPAGEEGQ